MKTTWCGKIKKDEWECYSVVTTQTKEIHKKNASPVVILGGATLTAD